jgi:hypothetical protein
MQKKKMLRICKNPGGTTPNKQTEEEKPYVGKSEGKKVKVTVFSPRMECWDKPKIRAKCQRNKSKEINIRRGERMHGGSFVPDKKRIYRGTFLIHIHLDEEDPQEG